MCQDGAPAMVVSHFTLSPIGVIAPENWSLRGSNRQPVYSPDCSDTTTTLCNQGAWADFGLAMSAIIPKQDLCTKYSPSTSCVSQSLTHCNRTLNEITRTMMVAFGRVVVSWCYDGGVRLTALDSYTTCLSVAMVDALTIRRCLTQINDPRAVGSANKKLSLSLPKLLNNVIDTYQSSAIVCMHSSISEACGEEAANLALWPAMDEIMAPTVPTTWASLSTTAATKNGSFQAINLGRNQSSEEMNPGKHGRSDGKNSAKHVSFKEKDAAKTGNSGEKNPRNDTSWEKNPARNGTSVEKNSAENSFEEKDPYSRSRKFMEHDYYVSSSQMQQKDWTAFVFLFVWTLAVLHRNAIL